MDHNGIYSNPSPLSLQQQTHMEAENADSRKRPLETPAEEAGCTKRTNTGGKRRSPPHGAAGCCRIILCGGPLLGSQAGSGTCAPGRQGQRSASMDQVSPKPDAKQAQLELQTCS